MTPRTPTGVYVHFPYCLKKCPYCDFVSFATARDAIDHAGYADAVIAELRGREADLLGRPISSVFFGGGTPSLWEPEELGRVLSAIAATGDMGAGDVEITVECNPTSLDEERARALRDVGVNRLSVGVQGVDAERLAFLGRLHDAAGGLTAVRAAVRSGMPRVSADLIYGVAVPSPGKAADEGRTETAAEARDEALAVAATGVTHLSAYSLTIEPATMFGELAKRGRLPIAIEDEVAEAFHAVDEALTARGFSHYEISNYAKPGDEARHNLGYWRGVDYVGLGCGAFGTVSQAEGSALRSRNHAEPKRYLAAVARGERPVESDETLDPETRLRERIMLGLRLREGLDLEDAALALGCDPWPASRKRAADRLVREGRLVVDEGRLSIPHDAWVFADGIAGALF